MTTAEQFFAGVSPALGHYEQKVLVEGVWKRPGLSKRDRSIATIAALITKAHTTSLPYYIAYGLDNGVQPIEVSEILTHLAFYTGWGNAMMAAPAIQGVFAERGIATAALAPVAPQLLPIDQTGEDRRASSVEQTVAPVSRALADDTGAVLFHDLWLRPALALRDRSLITVTALIASGQFAQITFHLGRAMDNGLTQGEASELLSHLAYYTGWPSAMSAAPVLKAVFERRAK